MSIFYKNFIHLCNEKGVAPSKAGQDVGVSSAAVSGWCNGAIPRKAVQLKLAQYFGCDVNDFFNENYGEDKKITATSGDGVADDRHAYVNSLFDQLTFENQIDAIDFLKKKLQSQAVQDVQQESD